MVPLSKKYALCIYNLIIFYFWFLKNKIKSAIFCYLDWKIEKFYEEMIEMKRKKLSDGVGLKITFLWIKH